MLHAVAKKEQDDVDSTDRAGLMTAALTLAVSVLSSQHADITAKEATELNAQAKATLAKFKADTKGSDAVFANAKGTWCARRSPRGGLSSGSREATAC
jgi:hypothetical protein